MTKESAMFGLSTLPGPKPVAAMFSADQYWPISEVHAHARGKPLDLSVLGLLKDWDNTKGLLFELGELCREGKVPAKLAASGAVKPLAPVIYPNKLICAGANFYAHVREMGTNDIDKAKLQPFFFLKPPSTTIVGTGVAIPIPSGQPDLDWELELAVVIGRQCKNISVAEAEDVIAGYAIAIDVTSRSVQFGGPARFRMDWFSSKCQDASCPIGPMIVPKEFIADVNDLGMRLSVNDKMKQFSSTADMIFSVHELVAAASQVCTLEPGDFVLTGTPHGVGHPRRDYLNVGDKMRASIDALGSLEVEITHAA
jgi:2-keto-4-pentenoate hydratase/2-oxohepta-3-ene-1,7-dioic acid hydratase in catechol pathway